MSILGTGIYNNLLLSHEHPTPPLTNRLISVGYDSGSNDHSLLSYDGTTWTNSGISGEPPLMNDVVFGTNPDRFVAVGGSNNAYSDDGLTWSTASRADSIEYFGVTYSAELGLYCSVGVDTITVNSVQTSQDGSAWTGESASDSYGWQDVEWSSDLSLFCAVGSTDGSVGGACIMTSSDGSSWTTRTATGGGNRLFKVKWASDLGIFCAVGDNGASQVTCSTDGINWTGGTVAEANEWTSLDYSPSLGLFVAVSTNGTNRAMRSTDGFNWTASTITTGLWQDIVWAEELGLFVAVRSNTGILHFNTSSDGITFSDVITSSYNVSLEAICWSSY